MNLRELLIKVGVDSGGTLQQLDRIDSAADRVKTSLSGVGAALGTITAGLGIGKLVDLANTLQNLQSRIDASNGGPVAGLFDELTQHANDARMSVEDYAGAWASMNSGMKAIGYGVNDTTKLVDTLSASFRINGTEAQTAAGALFQLTQSIGSGSVQMEELNSFMDASPALYRRVAESIGGNLTAFKKMVSQGKVSSKMLADAVIKENDRVMAQLHKMPKTLGDVWLVIKNDASNAFKKMVVDTNLLSDAAEAVSAAWGKVTKVWNAFVKASGGAKNAGRNIKDILTPLATLLTILAGFKALSYLSSPIGMIIALSTAIGLLYADYKVWKEGGESFIDWSKWQGEISSVGKAITWLMDIFKKITGEKDGTKAAIEAVGTAFGIFYTAKMLAGIASFTSSITGIGTASKGALREITLLITAAELLNKLWDNYIVTDADKAAGTTAGGLLRKDSPLGNAWDYVSDAPLFNGNWTGATQPASATAISPIPAPAYQYGSDYQPPAAPASVTTNSNNTTTINPTITVNVPPGTDGKQFADDMASQWAQGLNNTGGSY